MTAICSFVAAAAVEGFDLDEMQTHMLGCDICRPILAAMTTALQAVQTVGDRGYDDALMMMMAPDTETIVAWVDDDGGCEATDGCWVEVDGHCPHGYPSWAIVMGLV